MKPPRENGYRTAWAGDLRADDVEREVRVAGWVHRRRDHGGLIFIDLRDRTGLLQLVFRPEEAPEAHAAAHSLRAEDVLTARGRVVRREEGTVNPQLPTGEIELAVEEVELLADAETPPFEVVSDKAVDETLRLRYRYLDLRRERMRDSIELRHRVIDAMRAHLNGESFLEIETPFLTRSTPEGARDFLVPSRLAAGDFYALPQSPQLFKQLLMVSGFERYYQVVRCFRDEAARADRLPEFTQLDMELSFVEEEDVISVCEGLVKEFLAAGGVDVQIPFERLDYDDAMLRYGTDRPDRRIGMEIEELSEAFAQSEFQVFRGALESGGVVRGLRA
ncbi:MAG: aspartate--tRNA ligase, partial [Thermoleophilaceae bacterium]